MKMLSDMGSIPIISTMDINRVVFDPIFMSIIMIIKRKEYGEERHTTGGEICETANVHMNIS